MPLRVLATAWVAGSALFLCGCAATVTSYKPLTQAQVDSIRTVDLLVLAPESSVRVLGESPHFEVVAPPGVGPGIPANAGVLPMLVMVGINKTIAANIEREIEDLARSLERADPRRALAVALAEAATPGRRLNFASPRPFEKEFGPAALSEHARKAGSDVAIFVNLDHFFVRNSATPTIVGFVRVHGRDGNEIARDILLVQAPTAPGKEHLDNGLWWRDSNRYRNVLLNAARAVAVAVHREFLSRSTFPTDEQVKASLDAIVRDAPKYALATAPACMTEEGAAVRFVYTRTPQGLHVQTECVADGSPAQEQAASPYVWRSDVFRAPTPALAATMPAPNAPVRVAASATAAAPAAAAPAAAPAAAALAPSAAVVAPPPTKLAQGDRLVFREFDTMSGNRTGESVAVISRLSEEGVELNDGRLRLDRRGRLARGTRAGETTLSGTLPARVEVGATWDAVYQAVGLDFPPVTVQAKLVALEDRAIGPKRLSLAKVTISGMTPPIYVAGAGATTAFGGDVLVDVDTGLIVEARIDSRNRFYAIRRRLIDINR